MTSTHYKKLRPPIKKVKYVEVHRKRGSFYKEVMLQNQSSIQRSGGMPSTSMMQHAQYNPVDGSENWNDIPIYNAPHTKVCYTLLEILILKGYHFDGWVDTE